MRVDADVRGQLARRFEVLLPYLNVRQQRLALATEARLLGHGGCAPSPRRVASVLPRCAKASPSWSPVRIHCRSGERDGRTVDDDASTNKIRNLPLPCSAWWNRMSEGIRCPPCGGRPSRCGTWLRSWPRQGHPGSTPTVGRLLRDSGFSLQGTAKTLEGAQHPDRDAQFSYINEQVKAYQAAGEPVI